MRIVNTLAGALLVSAWLLVHAVFMVNANLVMQNSKNGMRDLQQFIPIRMDWPFFMNTNVSLCGSAFSVSVFQLSWFQKLLRQTFNWGQLAMPQGVCGDNCILYLSWIVSALTLAEWAAFTVLLLRAIWNKLIRPVVSATCCAVLAVGLYGCLRSCAFILAPHLPHDTAVAVVRILVSIDSALLQMWNSMSGLVAWALWALDGILSSLVWPSFEDIKDDAAHSSHRSLLTELLTKVQGAVTTHLPEALHAEL